ncbi:MAG: ABC transporter ATP-binding protein, partial [Planctomycetes bacterium]|nr:ABC transporter ATP-binding protein [Planctomycetota bacterium]
HVHYQKIEAIKGVSLEVDTGEIVTLIGGNGAGKTTTLACIAGLLRPSRGHITFAGGDLAGVAPHRVVERGLALVPEGRRIFPKLSVRENLLLGAYIRRDRAAIADDVERAFTLFPILRERASQAGGTLSGGEQQMLAIARALMSRPRLVCMDEPSMGVAPMLAGKIFAAIRQLNAEGLSVLLVEQNARMALKLAHRGYVIETGRTTLSDSAERLAADPRVQKAYLGECAV